MQYFRLQGHRGNKKGLHSVLKINSLLLLFIRLIRKSDTLSLLYSERHFILGYVIKHTHTHKWKVYRIISPDNEEKGKITAFIPGLLGVLLTIPHYFLSEC